MRRPLQLPQRARQSVALQNQFSTGRQLFFQHGERCGVITLLPARGRYDLRWPGFQCAGGSFALQTPNPLLHLLAECPPLHQPDVQLPDWYWRLLNQQLPPTLQTCWGPLSAATQPLPEEQTVLFVCRVSLEEEQHSSLLALTPAVLQHWFAQADWQPVLQPLPAELPLTVPLRVADIILTPARLAALQPGDLLLPPSSDFQPCGTGALRLGSLLIQGRLQPDSAPTTFVLSDYKESPMSYSQPPLSDGEFNSSAHGNSASGSAFQDLPLEMSIRCGSLRLTLGELRQLAPGCTLTVEHVIPGEALLCHGNFPVAKGELVDVEGRLGFEVVTLLSHAPLVVEEE